MIEKNRPVYFSITAQGTDTVNMYEGFKNCIMEKEKYK
jgi:hypothetical protein